MTAIMIAAVGALGALLAAVVPLAFVTERRRLMRFIRDEGDAIKELDDEEARDQILIAVRASSLRYQELATETKSETARRHMVVALAPCYLLVAIGVGLLLFAQLVFEGNAVTAARWGGGVLLVLGGLPLLYLFMRFQQAQLEDVRIATLRARAESAETALDEVETTLRDYTDPEAPWAGDEGGMTGDEIEELLAALERAVDTRHRSTSE